MSRNLKKHRPKNIVYYHPYFCVKERLAFDPIPKRTIIYMHPEGRMAPIPLPPLLAPFTTPAEFCHNKSRFFTRRRTAAFTLHVKGLIKYNEGLI